MSLKATTPAGDPRRPSRRGAVRFGLRPRRSQDLGARQDRHRAHARRLVDGPRCRARARRPAHARHRCRRPGRGRTRRGGDCRRPADATRSASPLARLSQEPAANTRPTQVRVSTTTNGRTSVVRFELDDYIARVVAGEGEPRAAEAAQQALAMTARTFALANLNRHRREGYDFCDTTHCQVLRAATAASTRAATATSGRVLLAAGPAGDGVLLGALRRHVGAGLERVARRRGLSGVAAPRRSL